MATCDAGHGCSITCSNGCGAVYNHTTGACTTWCEPSAMSVSPDTFDGKFSIEINDMSVAALSTALGEKHLDGGFKQLAGSGGRVSFKMESTDVGGVIEQIRKQAG